ncbi:nucleotide sugar dehydrogenase [Olivibacter ginsenosidimutans]|uniref:Nucleotide sugar dehydrogenase n=1 Tax=Olivibacter ginsenosidimutans TaxID=1176537 RepID=A0ABP9ASP0_9SPHI
MDKQKITIGIIGLGYVGLPLAVAFSQKYPVVGFDIDKHRVAALQHFIDHTQEVSSEALEAALKKQLRVSGSIDDLRNCNFYIVTVPTPVDKQQSPDLSALRAVSNTIGQVLKKGDIVVYESTVYPGATEEECVPALVERSGLRYNQDFFVGYSPERVNPGDKSHQVTEIQKITSGSTPEAAAYIDTIYRSIIQAGTHLAPSIQVAEAAKVIENAQRDVNIAFVNELAKIFNRLGIDTDDVLQAAATKWNFLPFKPGLVGGHCIGVDPYYLAQRAQKAGYYPEVILSGRKINNSMGQYVAHEVVKLMAKKAIPINNSKVLLLGFTFKENCPDIRNTKVFDIRQTLAEYGLAVSIYDPWAISEDVRQQYGFELLDKLPAVSTYDALILAVAHERFRHLSFRHALKNPSVVYDVKGLLPRTEVDGRL